MAGDGQIVLPLWHQISKDEVMRRSSSLADTVALQRAVFSVEDCAAGRRCDCRNVDEPAQSLERLLVVLAAKQPPPRKRIQRLARTASAEKRALSVPTGAIEADRTFR
jgi:hypothetical protein